MTFDRKRFSVRSTPVACAVASVLAVAAAIIGLQIVSRLPLLPFLLNAGRRVALIGTGLTGRRAAKAS